ncbi:phosphodiester glycosidase family protein [Thermolongibacillus altinsuensis]|uniref:phosphodiester glycosidase family protein n=1 Tax=Thermolongibacillus altinsuensis TaxID=575256 RepID=UPI00242A2BDC|nr:phosphodiester glycosidase family protein [Thermolongibacillus altinsuensis]GMB09325.1 hypothetical protein B1no1_20350 [Thermolongibacillus altinsuensis]
MKKHFLHTFVFVMFFFLIPTIAYSSTFGYMDENSKRTMVPIRFISEELGASVRYIAATKQIEIRNENNTIVLTIGSNRATVNNRLIPLEGPAVAKKGTTYVPIRFIAEAFGATVRWDGKERTVTVTKNNHKATVLIGRNNKTTYQQKTVQVNGRSITVNVVKVDLRNPNVELKVGLAKNRVGAVDHLANIAKSNSGKAAINGTFFDAYTAIKEPYGLLIHNGELVHTGRDKTVFGFDRNNNVHFDILSPSITGTVNGNRWYATWLNRTPKQGTSSSNIYTSARGKNIGFSYGTNIIVRNGKVTAITTRNVAIPNDGYVINFQGEERQSMLSRFKVGDTVQYTIDLKPKRGNTTFWKNAQGAIGAGPRLVTNGTITVTAKEEGFTEAKILTQRGARSAVGVTNDHFLLLATTPSATMNEWAHVMKALGAKDAMNLDGGASSGLYFNGRYITNPDRQISNALVIVER